MADVSRYDSGALNRVLITVASGVTVDKGDLMFLDNADNLRSDGSSTASNYAYPFEYLRISGSSLELNKIAVKSKFLGVALDGCDGDDNGAKNLVIGISGIFVFDLKPPKTVKVGDMFGASGTTIESDLLNQKVAVTTSTTKALGRFTEYKIHAQSAKVQINTIYSNQIS